MKNSIQKSQEFHAAATSQGKSTRRIGNNAALQRMVDGSPRQIAAQFHCPVKSVVGPSAPVQRAILKPGSKNAIYAKFPAPQLRTYGMLEPHVDYARELFADSTKYTLKTTVTKAAAAYKKANKGIRVYGKNPGTRLHSHAAVIFHFQSQGQDTTVLEDKLVTKSHGSAFDALLAQVPLTDADLLASSCASSTASSMYPDFTNFMNREHVPTMVRTPSFLSETIEAMAMADTSTGTGYVSSNKGSMLEAFVAHNYISGSSRVTVTKQGTMNCERSSDGYAGGVLYDTKFYDGAMAKSTNKNQWDDYREIVANGYTGSGGEAISSVCYVFPNILAANSNKHLKCAEITVAYPDKTTSKLKHV